MSRVFGHDAEEFGGLCIIGISGGGAVAVADLSDLAFLFLFQYFKELPFGWCLSEWIKCISNFFKKINPLILINLSYLSGQFKINPLTTFPVNV